MISLIPNTKPTTKKKYSPIPNDKPGGGGGDEGGGTACPKLWNDTKRIIITTKTLTDLLISLTNSILLTQVFWIGHKKEGIFSKKIYEGLISLKPIKGFLNDLILFFFYIF